jgi:REP element-mobilizing transposase RayT
VTYLSGLANGPVVPRELRVEYPGAIYQVMNRGDRRESVFLGDSDRQLFLETLAQTCEKTNWQVHAYGLMDHHFHLMKPYRERT